MTGSKAEGKDEFTKALEQLAERFFAWCNRRWKKWSLTTKLWSGVFLVGAIACLVWKIPFRTFAISFFTGAAFVMFLSLMTKDEFPPKEKKAK